MTAAIKNPRSVSMANKPRGWVADSLTSTWAWWKMHQTTGTTLDEATGKTGFDGQTINGTTTNIWTDNPNWFTPDVAADQTGNYIGFPQATADTLCSLDDLAAGGVLIMATVDIPATPPTGGQIGVLFQYGAGTDNIQGYLQYSANVNLNGAIKIGGTTTFIGATQVTAMAGAGPFTIAWYYDVSNRQMSHYTDIGAGVVARTEAIPAGALPGASTASSEGLGLLGRNNVASTTRWNSPGNECPVRDVFMIRFEQDRSSLINAIVQGYHDNGGLELPAELEGL